ncbi:fimbrial biogenesis chaperone [Enterobacillus tribolii]|uniref:P pilus assembly chaperone PapD n=1 Tax=Enterobacillus tribolii TaxID=1487935 RepID=A0A370QSG8_9GAMM|nr:molecular chaperone [Enterobacillus tribolii]MBW7983757.1 molecular chaperone [Enterobacillus tribolii]RDK92121.1 P pilus assembly chaperone PapD [Enterobacillus tribolii]
MKKIFFALTMLFSCSGIAGIQVDATRVIYNSTEKSSSLSIHNDGTDAYMVQTWLDTGDKSQMPKGLPVVVVPPILKLDGGKNAILRFIYSGNGLPRDRESIFWINVQEIPPAPKKENVLQIAVRTRIKLFYRPSEMKTTLDEQAKALTWQRQGNDLVAANNGPMFVTLGTVYFRNSQGKRLNVTSDMVAPGERIRVAIPAGAVVGGTISFSYINDYGGHTDVNDAPIK